MFSVCGHFHIHPFSPVVVRSRALFCNIVRFRPLSSVFIRFRPTSCIFVLFRQFSSFFVLSRMLFMSFERTIPRSLVADISTKNKKSYKNEATLIFHLGKCLTKPPKQMARMSPCLGLKIVRVAAYVEIYPSGGIHRSSSAIPNPTIPCLKVPFTYRRY